MPMFKRTVQPTPFDGLSTRTNYEQSRRPWEKADLTLMFVSENCHSTVNQWKRLIYREGSSEYIAYRAAMQTNNYKADYNNLSASLRGTVSQVASFHDVLTSGMGTARWLSDHADRAYTHTHTLSV